jgi:hypothetical protein
MRAHLKYFSYVVRHKWFVLRAGLTTGAPLWRLLVHDWSKFLPCEWFPYVRKFYGKPPNPNPAYYPGHGWREWIKAEWQERTDAAFDRAWNHHQKCQPHHWQYWLLVNDNPGEGARYAITSADGGMMHHSITEYTAGWEKLYHGPVAVDLYRVDEPSDPENVRYMMVTRLTEAANARRPTALPMPEHFVREMVADWMGAGRAITGRWEVGQWYAKNHATIQLHAETRALVHQLLKAVA